MAGKHFVIAGDYPLSGIPAGGVQSAMLSLVEGLAEQHGGNRITLLVLAERSAFEAATLPRGINVHTVSPVRSAVARPRFLWNVPGIRAALRQLAPDAVNVIDNPAFTIACWPIASKTVFTVHGIKSIEAGIWQGKDLLSHKAEAMLEKQNLARFTNFIAISAFADSFIRSARHGLPVTTAFIPNAVSSVFFRQRPTANTTDRIKIINVGTFSWLKSQHILLQALPALQGATGAKVEVTLIGNMQDPAYYQKLRELAGSNVRFLENCPPATIASELANADLMVHTSKQENQPMVFLEAMACGTPVLSSAVGGVPEMFRQESLGKLYPYGDTTALASAAVAILADTVGTAAMAARASAFAANMYSPESVATKTLQFLESINR